MSESDSEDEKRNQVQCDQCRGYFANKYSLKKHLNKSCPMACLNQCMWCGLRFKNRGVLGSHALKVHGDPSYQSQRAKSKECYVRCSACNASCSDRQTLRFHIRRTHFNLKGPIPFAEIKKVNQVWFEKALNNTIVEMKKTGPSKLIIRALKNTNIKICDVTPEMVDVSDVYPVNRGRLYCKVCKKQVSKKDYTKHYNEKHLNRKVNQCNNCYRTFSRHYLYLRHVCDKTRRLKGVTQTGKETDIVVASVESLSIPLGCGSN